jgi:XRE family transcriptional regulator, regulator of sulfur utilization
VQVLYRRIGANVRAARKAKRLSQDELADKSGLHRAHIGEIERGETNVTVLTLKILADSLGVTLSDLVKHA